MLPMGRGPTCSVPNQPGGPPPWAWLNPCFLSPHAHWRLLVYLLSPQTCPSLCSRPGRPRASRPPPPRFRSQQRLLNSEPEPCRPGELEIFCSLFHTELREKWGQGRRIPAPLLSPSAGEVRKD